MNGAERLFQVAGAAGLDVCFANPGTTEMPLVAALDASAGMRAVLGLFEGVCTGAADGYARMTGRPALTLLHLGPGFANGIANLHNARRAGSPLVNLIGDHATWHRSADAPLTSDIASLAAPVGWVRECATAADLAGDFAAAIGAATSAPGGVASLIVPADCQWDPVDGPPPRLAAPRGPAPVAKDRIEQIARALREASHPVLWLAGPALGAAGLRAAQRVAGSTGTALFCPTFPARLERGAGIPPVTRLPYFPEQAIETLAGVDLLVLVGGAEPVSFFGYPDVPSRMAPAEASVETLAAVDEDVVGALEDLVAALDAGPISVPAVDVGRPGIPTGDLDPGSLGAALAALQPEGAIVMDEGNTSSLPYFAASAGAPPHTVLALTGGAIGQGLPCATGAAVACPDRKVIALQADGSGLYTLQALWTQAREGLDVVNVICANRSYRILQVEMARAGIAEPGPRARALTDLSRPIIDWVELASGFGVPAARVESTEALVRGLERALSEPGPQLLEVVL